jgi:Ser/Thr protein kinase RdoA (MazF antagonist)
MASNNDSEHTVYACASSVREEFYNLCLLEAQDGESWAEDQRARFQIWGANLGVFASGHASSDYRLRGNNSIVGSFLF